MERIIEILIDNLKESFKAIEKFLFLGLTASLVLVVLALTNRDLSGEQKLMFVDMSAPASIVALACVGGLGMIALLLFYVPTHGASMALVTCGILGVPYVLLVAMAFKAAVDERFASGGPTVSQAQDR